MEQKSMELYGFTIDAFPPHPTGIDQFQPTPFPQTAQIMGKGAVPANLPEVVIDLKKGIPEDTPTFKYSTADSRYGGDAKWSSFGFELHLKEEDTVHIELHAKSGMEFLAQHLGERISISDTRAVFKVAMKKGWNQFNVRFSNSASAVGGPVFFPVDVELTKVVCHSSFQGAEITASYQWIAVKQRTLDAGSSTTDTVSTKKGLTTSHSNTVSFAESINAELGEKLLDVIGLKLNLAFSSTQSSTNSISITEETTESHQVNMEPDGKSRTFQVWQLALMFSTPSSSITQLVSLSEVMLDYSFPQN